MITLDTFKEDRFRSEFPDLPICFLLPDTNLFIKEEALKFCGWVDKGVFKHIQNAALTRGRNNAEKVQLSNLVPFAGIPAIHTFNGGKVDYGLAFPEARIHVLASSPRLVEVTHNGSSVGLGCKGAIIGNYEFTEGEGYEIHETNDREWNLTTLRTLHMVYLVGADNKPLHKIPLILSVDGDTAIIFGKTLELFYRLLEIGLTEHYGDNFYTLNEEARAAAIFQPTFGIEDVSSMKTSPVCRVKSFIEPEAATIKQHFNFEHAEMLWNTRKSLGNFASRYTADCK